MKTRPLPLPGDVKDTSRIFDTTEPLLRLKNIGEDEFERIVGEWAYSCLKEEKKYSNVALLGGSSDAGRDLVAYIDDDMQKFDIYQCKRYAKPITPSEYMIEFGKLCYYTFIGEYRIPNKYFIVASNGIGKSLRTLIENPQRINVELLNNWNSKCGKKKQIISEGIELTIDLKDYIEKFDFSIVSDIEPTTLVTQFQKSPWYKYHFGGGIKKRPKFEKPSEQLENSEKTMPYIKQLLQVYSNETGQNYNTQDKLKENNNLYKHFMRQREGFFSAQSLKRFVRDELFDEDSYDLLKDQIEFGIMDVYEEKHSSELERVKETIKHANCLSISCEEIKEITIQDKTGMCHELVNDEKIVWSDVDEDI